MVRTVFVLLVTATALSGCFQERIAVSVDYTYTSQYGGDGSGYSYQILAAPDPWSDQLSVEAQGTVSGTNRPDDGVYQLAGVFVDEGVPMQVKIFNGASAEPVASGSGVAVRCGEGEALFHVQFGEGGAASVSHGCA